MEVFVVKHSKFIITCSIFAMALVFIVSTGLSYAADNNSNEIYTRDELSEKVTPSNMFLTVYPIGSIYTSVSSTSPATLYGGTWVSFGSGRTLVGVDTSQTEFDMVEKVGGENVHLLTINEIPSHSHNTYGYVYASNRPDSLPRATIAIIDSYTKWSETVQTPGYSLANNGFTHGIGGSQAHNNLQPYITVYMWKRTA